MSEVITHTLSHIYLYIFEGIFILETEWRRYNGLSLLVISYIHSFRN